MGQAGLCFSIVLTNGALFIDLRDRRLRGGKNHAREQKDTVSSISISLNALLCSQKDMRKKRGHWKGKKRGCVDVTIEFELSGPGSHFFHAAHKFEHKIACTNEIYEISPSLTRLDETNLNGPSHTQNDAKRCPTFHEAGKEVARGIFLTLNGIGTKKAVESLSD